jgi:hypothetical protein
LPLGKFSEGRKAVGRTWMSIEIQDQQACFGEIDANNAVAVTPCKPFPYNDGVRGGLISPPNKWPLGQFLTILPDPDRKDVQTGAGEVERNM